MSKYIDADKLKLDIVMSANIEQIKATLERAGKTNLLHSEKVDLDKERFQLEATVNIEKIDRNLEKEYKEYVEDDPVFSKLTNRNLGLAIARHFAEWGADHLRDATKMVPVEGLEEAANKWGLENQEGFCTQSMKVAAFIAGAEWMAGQGATCNGEIQMDFSDPDDIYARRLSADYWNELGPALMKVEPGKVLIQIRKK